jgi:hypothetical protein
MLGNAKPPAIDNRYICIADRKSTTLTAVICSYLFNKSSYLPLFLFPTVENSKLDDVSYTSDHWFANLLGQEAGILINNAWARMGGSQYAVLAGLNEHQRSYLSLPSGVTVIDVKDLSDIDRKLSPITLPSQGELRCRTQDILRGLFVAQEQGKRLVLDEGAEPLVQTSKSKRGIVVAENVQDVSPIVAVNYASAIEADILLVEPLEEHQGREVQTWIQSWKESGEDAQFQKIKDAAMRRLGNVPFAQFEYATFFTEGLPYSLVLENVVPCSHVNLSIKPDLFVMNSILFQSLAPFHSAVLFSPVFFADEETDWLRTFFAQNKYYLRALIGADASFAHFDFNAQHFPYDLLHICSHGGEVDGYEMAEHFTDRSGSIHFIEFEEVVGFTPALDRPGMVEVHRKAFPRRLDGFPWMSEELKRQNFPHDVYTDMWNCIFRSNGKRKKKGRVALSCGIACADSIHQGEFHTLASHSSPLIFNNTCWSWNEVAAFFLSCGARGYVGTLWDIENSAAVLAAKTFYANVFSEPILSAFHKAIKAIDHTDSKDIYLFWGLHFTSLSKGQSPENSRARVVKELLGASQQWARKIESTKSAEVKRNSIKILKSILREIETNFASDVRAEFESKIKRTVPEISRRDYSRDSTRPEPLEDQSSIDFPIEYRQTKKSPN